MRTPETATIFARDLQAVDDMAAGWWTQDHIEHCRERELARHAAYDAAFDRMVIEVRAIDPRSQRWARDLLERLGDVGCRSGTPQFVHTVLALERMGITNATAIFQHDRWHIAATHLPAKVKATT